MVFRAPPGYFFSPSFEVPRADSGRCVGVVGRQMPKGARENRRDKEDEDADLAALALEAEPEGRYDTFHNDQPAFLLAKVDGDELAHLLESEHATPFDTPRMEDEVASVASTLFLCAACVSAVSERC